MMKASRLVGMMVTLKVVKMAEKMDVKMAALKVLRMVARRVD